MNTLRDGWLDLQIELKNMLELGAGKIGTSAPNSDAVQLVFKEFQKIYYMSCWRLLNIISRLTDTNQLPIDKIISDFKKESVDYNQMYIVQQEAIESVYIDSSYTDEQITEVIQDYINKMNKIIENESKSIEHLYKFTEDKVNYLLDQNNRQRCHACKGAKIIKEYDEAYFEKCETCQGLGFIKKINLTEEPNEPTTPAV